MNIPTSIHESDFDPLDFEANHQRQFERSQKEQKFSQQYQDDLRNTFSDGVVDGRLGFEPEAYQWFTTRYRRGYRARCRAKIRREICPITSC